MSLETRGLKGSARNWAGKYQQSLRVLEQAGLIEETAGPKGGSWYFVATPKLYAIAQGANS
jgi:hypothetical protein